MSKEEWSVGGEGGGQEVNPEAAKGGPACMELEGPRRRNPIPPIAAEASGTTVGMRWRGGNRVGHCREMERCDLPFEGEEDESRGGGLK